MPVTQKKKARIAALKLIALGEQDRIAGKGISAAESRAQLLAARQNRQLATNRHPGAIQQLS